MLIIFVVVALVSEEKVTVNCMKLKSIYKPYTRYKPNETNWSLCKPLSLHYNGRLDASTLFKPVPVLAG